MNIDTNTVLFVAVSFAAAYFAFQYFRMKINQRFEQTHRMMEDNLAEIYTTTDRIYRQIHALDKRTECCDSKTEKNYYNTGA